ncbi:MAG TPA: nuclear transport factor 2 family protein [Gaiellaceae bacterium]|jgi:predicted ester cyclase
MAAIETASMTETAKAFFDAVDTGQGWEACSAFCHPDATFTGQAEPLAEIQTLADYAEWMKGLMSITPDGRYEMKAFAVDPDRQSVVAYAVFHATHTGEGGPVPPTGRSTNSDYVYVMEFDGDKIRHMTKIWNAGWALRELGWAN